MLKPGELGAIFACPSTAATSSIVFYKPYDSWTSVQEWQYSLPGSENVIAIAVGGMDEPLASDSIGIAGTGTVLVATDKGFLRFLSGSGLQKYVWNLGEEVVSMAAGKDWALIVHRDGAAGDGRQNLSYSLLDTDTFEIVQAGKIPLGKDTTLTWCGFTDDDVRFLPCRTSQRLTRLFVADSSNLRFERADLASRSLTSTTTRTLDPGTRHEYSRTKARKGRIVLADRID